MAARTRRRFSMTLRQAVGAAAVTAGVLAMTATPAAAASSAGAKHVVASALNRFDHNAFAHFGLPVRHAVTVRVCYHRVCATQRLRPDPVCHPSDPVCIGTAARAIRLRNGLTVAAEYA